MNFDDLMKDKEEDLGPDRTPSGVPQGRNLGLEAGMGLDSGAAERYRARIPKFEQDGKPLPKLRHHSFWLLHNCVAHPVLAVLPFTFALKFHELTSAWLNHVEPFHRDLGRYRPAIRRPALWALHNLGAHVAIGLWPSQTTFRFHDWSAKAMAVPGWV
jgi:hypothetical protein